MRGFQEIWTWTWKAYLCVLLLSPGIFPGEMEKFLRLIRNTLDSGCRHLVKGLFYACSVFLNLWTGERLIIARCGFHIWKVFCNLQNYHVLL